LDEWQHAGVWERLHERLLAELRAAGEIEWSRAVADSSHVQAKKGALSSERHGNTSVLMCVRGGWGGTGTARLHGGGAAGIVEQMESRSVGE
jgi:hypothetical protein